tara:strand:- start:389 stop:748 length:360 start_codon:yes stop_codon:yes gene_type:complete
MVTVTKIFTFDSAHWLPKYKGKCKNTHGHTYKLEVEVEGDIIARGESCEGMVIDFAELKGIVNREIIDKLDHINLNTIFPVPTAEIMTLEIFKKLKALVNISRIRLWETPTSYAEVKSK